MGQRGFETWFVQVTLYMQRHRSLTLEVLSTKRWLPVENHPTVTLGTIDEICDRVFYERFKASCSHKFYARSLSQIF